MRKQHWWKIGKAVELADHADKSRQLSAMQASHVAVIGGHSQLFDCLSCSTATDIFPAIRGNVFGSEHLMGNSTKLGLQLHLCTVRAVCWWFDNQSVSVNRDALPPRNSVCPLTRQLGYLLNTANSITLWWISWFTPWAVTAMLSQNPFTVSQNPFATCSGSSCIIYSCPSLSCSEERSGSTLLLLWNHQPPSCHTAACVPGERVGLGAMFGCNHRPAAWYILYVWAPWLYGPWPSAARTFQAGHPCTWQRWPLLLACSVNTTNVLCTPWVVRLNKTCINPHFRPTRWTLDIDSLLALTSPCPWLVSLLLYAWHYYVTLALDIIEKLSWTSCPVPF